LDAGVVLRDLLRPGEIGPEGLKHGGSGEAGGRVLRRAVQESAPAHVAVHVAVEELQHFRREIACFLAFHRGRSFVGTERQIVYWKARRYCPGFRLRTNRLPEPSIAALSQKTAASPAAEATMPNRTGPVRRVRLSAVSLRPRASPERPSAEFENISIMVTGP